MALIWIGLAFIALGPMWSVALGYPDWAYVYAAVGALMMGLGMYAEMFR